MSTSSYCGSEQRQSSTDDEIVVESNSRSLPFLHLRVSFLLPACVCWRVVLQIVRSRAARGTRAGRRRSNFTVWVRSKRSTGP